MFLIISNLRKIILIVVCTKDFPKYSVSSLYCVYTQNLFHQCADHSVHYDGFQACAVRVFICAVLWPMLRQLRLRLRLTLLGPQPWAASVGGAPGAGSENWVTGMSGLSNPTLFPGKPATSPPLSLSPCVGNTR